VIENGSDFPGNRSFQKALDPFRLRMPKPYYPDPVRGAPGKDFTGSMAPVRNQRYPNPALIDSVIRQYCGSL